MTKKTIIEQAYENTFKSEIPTDIAKEALRLLFKEVEDTSKDIMGDHMYGYKFRTKLKELKKREGIEMKTKLTEREKNLSIGVKDTLKVNSATPEEIIKVCKAVIREMEKK